jgi:hypothetical protein
MATKNPKLASGYYDRAILFQVFYHPDFTVGTGVSPVQPFLGSWAFTTDRGISPRPEDLFYYFQYKERTNKVK